MVVYRCIDTYLYNVGETLTVNCVEFCRVLGDETRQQILRLLIDRQELCVSDIVEVVDVAQPTISHHLNVLRQMGLVTRRKQGRQVFYSVDHDYVVDCCGRLFTLLEAQQCCRTRTFLLGRKRRRMQMYG
jgi:DNA-binding transcriptional ArsR family regulator